MSAQAHSMIDTRWNGLELTEGQNTSHIYPKNRRSVHSSSNRTLDGLVSGLQITGKDRSPKKKQVCPHQTEQTRNKWINHARDILFRLSQNKRRSFCLNCRPPYCQNKRGSRAARVKHRGEPKGFSQAQVPSRHQAGMSAGKPRRT